MSNIHYIFLKEKIGLILSIPLSVYLVGLSTILLLSCKQESANAKLEREHPCLILTANSVNEIKAEINDLPILNKSFNEIRNNADQAINEGIIVPVPVDLGGGYTHEKHKSNYLSMYNAGISYQITKEVKYASFVKEMLLEYAKLYPKLGLHPQAKDQAPGKLFWQGLNESVWLVYTIQAYDCVYNFLSKEERDSIENNVFHPMVNFFTDYNKSTFDKIHNHGTWAAAGVGMTGLVINDTNYVEMALYGSDKKGEGGFIKQIDELFSPDGFYAEGPYYQRYAIMPFILFAQALENNRPEVDIFRFKDSVLNKAVTSLVQLTNSDGRFFPINDAIKEKDLQTPEMIYAIDIVYNNTRNKELLSIAVNHDKVMISKEGLHVAKDINLGLAKELERKSLIIRDGKDGTLGGVAIIRRQFDGKEICLVLKANSQGMGHGHFDRLAISIYEDGNEILQDYGAARFHNIEEKQGGRYLPENNSWAKQTVAHNTLVINQESDFNFNLKKASDKNPQLVYSDLNSPDFQIVSVTDSNCYEESILTRTLAMISINKKPFIIDLFKVDRNSPAIYDLPVYYMGQLISTSFDYYSDGNQLKPMGKKNGYQHLWNTAHSSDLQGLTSLTWLNNFRFYTCSFLADSNSEVFLTRIGANDPDFNLRNDPGILFRQNNASNYRFLSLYEMHGIVDPALEIVEGSSSNLKNISFLLKSEEVSIIRIKLKDGTTSTIGISHRNNENAEHSYTVEGEDFEWKGNYFMTQSSMN